MMDFCIKNARFWIPECARSLVFFALSGFRLFLVSGWFGVGCRVLSYAALLAPVVYLPFDEMARGEGRDLENSVTHRRRDFGSKDACSALTFTFGVLKLAQRLVNAPSFFTLVSLSCASSATNRTWPARASGTPPCTTRAGETC